MQCVLQAAAKKRPRTLQSLDSDAEGVDDQENSPVEAQVQLQASTEGVVAAAREGKRVRKARDYGDFFAV
jgi:hypothetical protein